MNLNAIKYHKRLPNNLWNVVLVEDSALMTSEIPVLKSGFWNMKYIVFWSHWNFLIVLRLQSSSPVTTLTKARVSCHINFLAALEVLTGSLGLHQVIRQSYPWSGIRKQTGEVCTAIYQYSPGNLDMHSVALLANSFFDDWLKHHLWDSAGWWPSFIDLAAAFVSICSIEICLQCPVTPQFIHDGTPDASFDKSKSSRFCQSRVSRYGMLHSLAIVAVAFHMGLCLY